MKATLLYAYYQMEGLWKYLLGVTLFLAFFVGYLVEIAQSYQCLMGFSLQIPCTLTLVTAQRQLKQHQEGWSKYALILPMSRGKIIQSEYILFALMCIISLFIVLILVVSSTIMGFFVTKNDLGILLGITVFVSMNSQLFFFLLSNHCRHKYAELVTVISIYVTCMLLSLPYFFNKDSFSVEYASNPAFGSVFFLSSVLITSIFALIVYKILLFQSKKRASER